MVSGVGKSGDGFVAGFDDSFGCLIFFGAAGWDFLGFTGLAGSCEIVEVVTGTSFLPPSQLGRFDLPHPAAEIITSRAKMIIFVFISPEL